MNMREYDEEIARIAGEAPPLSDAERATLKAEIVQKLLAAEQAPPSAIEKALIARIDKLDAARKQGRG